MRFVRLGFVSDPVNLNVSLIRSDVPEAPTALCRRSDGHEFLLHSRQDPIKEARLLVKDTPLQERTLYVVLGFGLGYHVHELLKRIPGNSHVLVIEPYSACLSGSLNAQKNNRTWMWMRENRRLHFFAHHDARIASYSAADRLVSLRLLALQLFTHAPSCETDEAFYKTAISEIPQKFPNCFESRMAFIDKTLDNHLCNFWSNLPHSWNAAPVNQLKGAWKDRKLIIVSAGPSLADALPLLREMGNKAFLLATGTAVRILLENQIRPDLIISMDPFEANLAHFQGWDSADIPMAYYHQIYRGVLTAHPGKKFFYVMKNDRPIPLRGSKNDSTFVQGGSVALSALQLAHHMNATPIIFVGQDFSFPGGHTHVAGSIYNQSLDLNQLPNDFFMIPGVNGAPVITNHLYYSYLLYMQDFLFNFSRNHPVTRHINTSQIGASIQGMEPMTLAQALALPAVDDELSPRYVIESALVQNQRISPKARMVALNQWESELQRLLARSSAHDNFESLFDKFRSTATFAQAGRTYEDFYYLYEINYRKQHSSETATIFFNRFHNHLQFVLQQLSTIKTAMA
jgi:hypothetical protein